MTRTVNEINPKADIQIAVLVDEKTLLLFGWIDRALPSSGTARFSSGLSTHTFLRPVNLIEYDEAALKDISEVVINFADAEDLPAHGEAIRARFETLPTTDNNA